MYDKELQIPTWCRNGLGECAGCAKWGPHFEFTLFEGTPIFSLRALKISWAFVHDCIFSMITYYLLENLVWRAT